jgi:hypothetical protein
MTRSIYLHICGLCDDTRSKTRLYGVQPLLNNERERIREDVVLAEAVKGRRCFL